MDDEQPIDPYKEIMDNIDLLSPVKRCPKCNALTLKYDEKSGRIYCEDCGFERFLPRMEK